MFDFYAWIRRVLNLPLRPSRRWRRRQQQRQMFRPYKPMTDDLEPRNLFTITPTTQPLSFLEGLANPVVVATFTESDAGTTPGDYTASIDWGDASPLDTGTVSINSAGNFQVTGTHAYPEETSTPYIVTATIYENVDSHDVQPVSTTGTVGETPVSITPLVFSPTENGAITATVATFVDPGGADPDGGTDLSGPTYYTATIFWGDGASDIGTISYAGSPGSTTGVFSVVGTHTYGEEGTHTLTVTVNHLGSTANGTETVSIAEVPVTGTGVAVSGVTEGTLSSGLTVATFTDPAGAEPNDGTHYTATINWGDGGTVITGNLTFSGSTFTVLGDHSFLDEGTFTVTVTVNHEGSLTTFTSTATVAEGDALTGSAPAISATEGASYSGTIATFTNSDLANPGTDFTAVIFWGDGSSTVGTVSSGVSPYDVTGTHTYAEEGSYTVSVVLSDDAPGIATFTATSTATVADPSVIATDGFNVNGTEGTSTGTITIATFTDPGTPAGEVVGDYSAVISWGDGITSFGTIANSGGTFTLTGSHIYAEEGSYTVTTSITHDTAASVPVTDTASIIDPSVVPSSVAVSATEGQAFIGMTVATFTDPGDPTATVEPITDYSATIDWGDGTSTSVGNISLSGTTFTVTGDHTYIEEGSYTVSVVINHDTSTPVTVTDAASVADPDVVATAGATLNTTEGTSNTGVTVATFTDPGGAEPTADYSATIFWGDGGSSGGTITEVGTTASYTVTGDYTYVEEGNWTVSVVISHETSTAQTVTFAANVADPSVVPTSVAVSGTEGAALTGVTVATFTDPGGPENAADYSATIFWGDGGSSAGTISEVGSTNSYTVTGTYTYLEEGSYTVSVVINHDASTPATVTDAASVADPSVVPSSVAVGATEGQAFTGLTVATFTDPGTPAGEVLADYSAVIDWGDTETSVGAIINSGGTFTVTGDHTYIEEGSYTVTVVINHDASSPATVADAASVTDPSVIGTGGISVNETEGAAFAGLTVATFTDPGDPTATVEPLGDYSATIDWGDGTSTSVGNITLSGTTFTVTGDHTYGEEGSYTIAVTLNHDASTPQTVTDSASVADPDVTAAGVGPFAASEGQLFTGTVATFSDPGGAEPNSYDPGTIDGNYSAVINWGDGFTNDTGTITYTGTAGDDSTTNLFVVSGTHTFGEEGTFTVTVTINHEGSTPQVVTFTASVDEVPVVASGVTTIAATEGLQFSNVTVATFVDPAGAEPNSFSTAGDDGNTIPNTYQAIINWGDGTQTTGTITYSGAVGSSVGVFSVLGNHTYGEEGTFSVTTTVFHEVAQNLVTDGGFQNGTASWSTTGTVSTVTNAATSDPDGDSNSHAIAFPGPTSTLSQTITDLNGQDYQLNFWIKASGANEFQVQWDNQIVFDQQNLTTPAGVFGNYEEFSVPVTGIGSDTLTFVGTGGVTLDNVQVIANTGGVTAGTTVNVADPSIVPTGGLTVAATESLAVNNVTVATFTDPGGVEPNQYDNPATPNLVINPGFETDTFHSPPFGWTDSFGPAASSVPFLAHSGTNSALFITNWGLYQNISTVPGTQYEFSFWLDSAGDPGNEFQVAWDGGTILTVTDVPADGYHQYVFFVTATSGSTTINFQDPSGAFNLDDVNVSTLALSDHYTADIGWGDGLFSPGVISVSGATFTVVGTHTYGDEGTYTVSVILHHETSPDVTVTDTATVADNDIITGISSPAISATEGTSISGTIATFSDSSYPNNPPSDFGAVIDWGDGTTSAGAITGIGSGQFAITGAHTYADEGTFLVTTTMTDDSPGTATGSITTVATIADGDVLSAGASVAIAGTEGAAFSGTVANFTNIGTYAGPASDFVAIIMWDDGFTTAGTVVSTGAGSYAVLGSHTFAEEGAFSVTVTLSEEDLGTNPESTATATTTNSVTVAEVAVTGSGSAVSATEGGAFAGAAVATFTDPAGAESIGEYTATIDWGDGQTSAGVIAVSGTTFTVTSDHTYSEEGAFLVTTTVDHNGDITTLTSTATVAEVPVVGTGVDVTGPTEGAAFSGATVATFTDPAGAEALGDYAATVYWGDGQTSAGSITVSGGTFTVTGDHTYAEEGAYNVTTEINHEGTLTDLTSTATIAEVPVVGTGVNVSGVSEGTPFANAQVATFSDPAGAENLTDYTATIDWGDGQTSVGFVSGVGTSFTVNGNHTYAEDGTFLVTTTIDHEGDTTTLTSVATVNDVAVVASSLPVSASEGIVFTAPTATFTDPGAPESASIDYSATIDWGDGATSTGAITLSGTTFTVSGTHTYAEEGGYIVTTVVYHESTPPQTVASTAVVSDPAVVAASTPVTGTEGVLFTSQPVATFTDPGGAESLGDYVATIDWGDGTGLQTGTITLSGSTFTVSGSHTYAEEGAFTTVVVINHEGVFTSVTGSATVADQSVTGTGVTIFASEGTLFTGVPVATFVDPAGTESAADYSAVIDWGDGQTSAGTFDTFNGLVRGDHTYSEEGPYTVTVTMFHETAPSTVVVSTATVAEVPVTAIGIPVSGATEGGAISGAQVAAFADPAGAEANDGTHYTATINWGDGSSTTIGTLTYIASTQTFIVNGSHTYSEEGTYIITTSIDHEGDLTIATSTASVDEVPVVGSGIAVSATESVSLSGVTTASFTDPSLAGPETLGNYTATIDWGDGTTTAGAIALSGGVFYVTGNHTYAEEGAYTVATTINHEGSLTTLTSAASVADQAVVGAGVSITGLTEGATFPFVPVATFGDPAGPESSADYTATIDWGDGQTSTGVVTAVGSSFQVAGSHTYAEEGTWLISTTINHETATPTTVTSQATVADPAVVANPVAMTASEGIAFAGATVATFSDPGGPEAIGDYSATIYWGDGQSSAGSIVPIGSTFAVTGDHTYAEEGPYNITTIINHDASVPQTVIGPVNVVETPLAGSSTAISATEGALFTSQPIATFTDLGGPEVLGDYAASVDWGDGTGLQIATISLSGATFTVSGTHTYAEEGTFVATVFINHEGNVTTVTSLATVSDPNVVAAGVAVTGSEGTAFTAWTATFTDPGGPETAADYSATIDWGDGGTSTGIVFYSGGTYSVTGTHAYAEEGTYLVTTTVNHEASTAQTVTSVATVAELGVHGSGTAVSATEGSAFAGASVATFTDPAGAEATTDYVATIDWGDGATAAGSVALSGSTFTVTGAHTYAEEGTFLVTTTVNHEGVISSWTSIATVTEVPVVGSGVNVPGATENAAFAGATVATFTDPAGAESTADYNATIWWGDGATSTGAITVSAGTFSVTGGHTYAQEGTYLVTTVVNHEGDTTTLTSTATVAEVPVVGSGVNVSGVSEGAAFSNAWVANFTDPAGPESTANYSVSINWGDGATSIGIVTALGSSFGVSGSHTYAEEGTFTISTIVNHDGALTTLTSVATVAEIPVVGTGLNVSATEGGAFAGASVATFTDPAGAEVTGNYIATIDWGDGATSAGAVGVSGGTFTVTGGHSYAEEGTYLVTTSINHEGDITTLSSVATVTEVPVVGSGVAVSATEGTAFASATVATFTDPAGPEVTGDYVATIWWGDGATSTGSVTVSGGTFSVTGGHTYAEEGTYLVTAVVNHEGSTTTLTSTATVAEAPVVGSGVAVSATEGLAFNNSPVATFTDPVGPESVSDYSVTINWGDGATSLGVVTALSGSFGVTGSHVYAEEGTYLVTTTINHEGSITTATSVATVADLPVVVSGVAITASEGTAFSAKTVATFTDPGGPEATGDYSATIAWGDGLTSAGAIVASGGTYLVQGTHTYAEEGAYAVTTVVNHLATTPQTVVSAAAVAELPVSGTGVAVAATEGLAFIGTPVATFTDPAGAESTGEYVATIDWGDNTGLSGGAVTLSGSTFTVAGNHTYAEEGSYVTTVVIVHDGLTTTVTAAVSVSDPSVVATGLSPNVTEGVASSGVAVATFTDPGGPEAVGDYSATITWGDGGTSTGTITYASGVFSVNGSHAYTEEGTYAVSVTINHDVSTPQTVTSTANVAEAPVVGTGTAVSASEGAAFASTAVATFTDPAGAEALGNYTATIAWGDGNTSAGTVTLSGGVFTVAGAHTFAEEGTFAVVTTINHEGALTTLTSTASVADQPVVGVGVGVSAVATASFTATIATFTDPAGAEATADYSAVINWGDGATSTGAIAVSGSTFSVQGSHTYALSGTFTISTVLNHDSATPQVVTGTASVVGGLPFFDNFNTGSSLSSNWTVQSGTIFVNTYATGALTPITNVATVNGTTATDVSVQANVNYTQLQTYAGLIARFTGAGTASSFYLGDMAVIANPNNPTQPIFQAAIYRVINGNATLLVNNNLPAAGNGILRFDVEGPSLKLYLNGQLVAFAQDTMLTSGVVGMRLSTVSLDNFSANAITQPTTTLPYGPDSFNANPPGNQLGSNWLEEAGNFNVSTGAAMGQANLNLAVLTHLSAANQAIQATPTFTANGQTVGLVARYQGPLDNNEYIGSITRNTGVSYTLAIFKNIAGNVTSLGSKVIASGTGTLQFDVVGTSLKLYLNNTLEVYAQDSTIAAGSAGIRTAGASSVGNFSVSSITQLTPSLGGVGFTDTFPANPPTNQLDLNWNEPAGNFAVQPGGGAIGQASPSDAVLNGVSVADATIQANINFTASGANFGLLGRYEGPGDGDAYLANLTYNGGSSYSVTLYKSIARTWLKVGSTVNVTSASASHTLKFVLSGTSLTISLDGSSVVTQTDSTIAGPGSVGMRTTTTGVTVTSFSATSP